MSRVGFLLTLGCYKVFPFEAKLTERKHRVTEAISNTSPLLYLQRIGAIDWLWVMFERVLVPSAVVKELEHGRRRGFDWCHQSFHDHLQLQSQLVGVFGMTMVDGESTALIRQLYGPPHQRDIGLGFPVMEHHPDHRLRVRGHDDIATQGIFDRFECGNPSHQTCDVVGTIGKKATHIPPALPTSAGWLPV